MLATLRWGGSVVHVAPWSPGREPAPWWLSLATEPHLSVHLEALDEPPAVRLPRAPVALTLAGSLVAHVVLLVAMYMALPGLALPSDETASPWLEYAWVHPLARCTFEGHHDEDVPDVATRATSSDPQRPPHVAFDGPTEVSASRILGGEPGVEAHTAMPTERGLHDHAGLRDVVPDRQVDPSERLRQASWHHVVPGETLSSIAARHASNAAVSPAPRTFSMS